MNVHLERDWMRGGYRVTFYDRAGAGMVDVLRHDPESALGDGWKRVRQSFAEEIGEPSLFLPGDVLEALLREAGKVLQSSDATVEALADARTVRDRLLVLVEQGWATP